MEWVVDLAEALVHQIYSRYKENEMIDPAKIKSVLSKASDEQLMQMLKKPDQIPSMFVQQEIARRNKARQASKAQLAALADATKSRLPVTMTPEQPVTPRGQPIYPETRDGITYMKPGSKVEQRRVNWDKEVPAILAFARESGNAIGRLDNNQEANLMEWINFRKENPRNLADVEKVINWINQGVITSPNIAKLKNMATQVLDENNYDPTEPGGSLYKGFVVEKLFPFGKEMLKGMKETYVDPYTKGVDKIYETLGEVGKRAYEGWTGNKFNENNPAPDNAVDQAISESGAIKAQEFKRLEEADQPRPQDFLPMQEAQRREANRLAMVNAQRNQGLADFIAEKDARRMDGFRKAQQMKGIETLEDRALANYNPNMEEVNRLRGIESQRLTEMANDPFQTVILDGNRVVRLPGQNPDLRRAEIAELQNRAMGFSQRFPNPEDKFREREIAQNIDPSTNVNVPSNFDNFMKATSNKVTDFVDTIKGQLPEFKKTSEKVVDFIQNPDLEKINPELRADIKEGIKKLGDTLNVRSTQEVKNNISRLFTPLKRYNPKEDGEEFIISPEENEPYIPETGLSRLGQGIVGARRNYYKDRENDANNLIAKLQNQKGFYSQIPDWIDRDKILARKDEDIADEQDAINRYKEKQAGSEQYYLDRPEDLQYGKYKGTKYAYYDPTGKDFNLEAYGGKKGGRGYKANVNQMRTMEGQAFGQDYRTGPITAKDYDDFLKNKELAKPFKENETTSPAIDFFNRGSNMALEGIETLRDNIRYKKPQDWKAREEAMDQTFREPLEELKATDEGGTGINKKIEDLGNKFTTKIEINSDTYKDTKKLDNKFKKNNTDTANSLVTDADMSNVVNSAQGGPIAKEYQGIVDAQNKLIDAMKPAGEANNRFWGLVAGFGAKLTATDWQDALNQTMAEFKDMRTQDKANFVEMAKLGYAFEKDKMDHAFQLARLRNSQGSAANSYSLGQLRIAEDAKDRRIRGLGILQKSNDANIKALEGNMMLQTQDPEGYKAKMNDLLKEREQIGNDIRRINSGADMVYTSSGLQTS